MKKTGWGVLGLVFGIILLIVLASYGFSTPSTTPHTYKVAILVANDLRLAKVEGLKQGLQELGYTEGEDLTYHVENAKNDLQQMTDLGKKLLQEKPDVLVAAGAVEAQALKKLTARAKNSEPVVFMGTLSPVDIGLVQNSARPGGNLTGLNNYHFELTPKRLELLHHLLPNVKTVAVLGDTRVPIFERIQIELNKVGQAFGLTVRMYTAMNSGEIQQALKKMQDNGAQAVILLPGFFLETSTKQIVELATARKLPVFGVYPEDIDEGCFAAYGTSNREQGIQSAHMVSKILRGSNASEIPIETPDRIVFSVNLQVAMRLGIQPSPSVLSFADRVVQP